MAKNYDGMAVGAFELDNLVACFVALDAAMEVALETAKPLGKIVSHTVIASPSADTEVALKMTINK